MNKKILCPFLILLLVVLVFAIAIIPTPGSEGTPGKEGLSTTPVVTTAIEDNNTNKSLPDNTPVITGEEAKAIAIAAFPEIIGAKTAKIRLDNTPGLSPAWEIRDQSAQVWVDTMTGEISVFALHHETQGRQAEPAITMEEAQLTADDYFSTKSDGADLKLTKKQYTSDVNPITKETVAGEYVFGYTRFIRGIPCASDALYINIDAVSGEICGFDKSWKTDEADCQADTTPSVSDEEAGELLESYLSENYGDIPGLETHRPLLAWVDGAGSIRLAWKVEFDSDLYKSLEYPRNASSCIDAHSGKVFNCYYNSDIS